GVRAMVAGKKVGHSFNWLLRSRKADAHRAIHSQCIQAFERKGKVSTTLVVSHGVDFIHDDGIYVSKNAAALLGRKQDVKRFRRGHQNVWRSLKHPHS